jgi:hypothetical protein
VSAAPTPAPTYAPTDAPTHAPTDAPTEQLTLEEKVYDKENLIEWVPNSSMELNGKRWEFTVPLLNGPQVRNKEDPGPGCSSGATYSCRLSKSKNIFSSYVIDCDKSGGNGKGDTLYFRDSEGGKDGTYSLCMRTNTNHVVRFNSKKPNIVSVGYTLCAPASMLFNLCGQNCNSPCCGGTAVIDIWKSKTKCQVK